MLQSLYLMLMLFGMRYNNQWNSETRGVQNSEAQGGNFPPRYCGLCIFSLSFMQSEALLGLTTFKLSANSVFVHIIVIA